MSDQCLQTFNEEMLGFVFLCEVTFSSLEFLFYYRVAKRTKRKVSRALSMNKTPRKAPSLRRATSRYVSKGQDNRVSKMVIYLANKGASF